MPTERKAKKLANEVQQFAGKLSKSNWLHTCESFNEQTTLRRM